jgi:hypothetical protein
MERTYDDEERDIQLALNHHASDPKLKWAKLAKIYNVPYQRLLARRAGRGDRSHSGGHNKALTTDQEFALNRIIDRMERDGMHARISMIPSIANFLVKQWEAEAIERSAQELETAATLARAAGRMAEFYNELISNETIGFYSTLRPQGTIEGFDEFDSEELEDLEGIMS